MKKLTKTSEICKVIEILIKQIMSKASKLRKGKAIYFQAKNKEITNNMRKVNKRRISKSVKRQTNHKA